MRIKKKEKKYPGQVTSYKIVIKTSTLKACCDHYTQ